MRILITVKGTPKNGMLEGEVVVRDRFDLPLVYTQNGFEQLVQNCLTLSFEYLRTGEADTIVIERVRPTAVDNGDGTGSLKGELVGMGL